MCEVQEIVSIKALKAHVAATVKRHRIELNMTQPALGDHVGLSETTISRIERGEYLPTLEKTYELAKALRIHPIELLSGDPLSEFIKGLPRDQQVELHQAIKALLKK
jgi:DNA-binding XRE family transcriptional regulator